MTSKERLDMIKEIAAEADFSNLEPGELTIHFLLDLLDRHQRALKLALSSMKESAILTQFDLTDIEDILSDKTTGVQ